MQGGQGITAISRRPLHEAAVDRLRELIVQGRLAPGERLNERLLCERLAISRTPLREALKLLATEGLVELLPNRGAIVARLEAARITETLGVMGALNVVGTVASGWICDRFGQKVPLAGYYFLRGVSLLFLPYVGTVPGLFAFAAIFGLNYISTVPATTALTAKIYGRYSVGELSGWIFFSHQLGSAVGSLAGGYLYDRFGDYTVAFHSAALVAFVATGLVLALREQPAARRPAVVPSAA